jgi:hypothetical protein
MVGVNQMKEHCKRLWKCYNENSSTANSCVQLFPNKHVSNTMISYLGVFLLIRKKNPCLDEKEIFFES